MYGYNKTLNRLHLLNLQKGIWETPNTNKTGNPSSPRGWHSISIIHGYLIVYGGMLHNGEASNEIFLLVRTRLGWIQLKTSESNHIIRRFIAIWPYRG